MQIASSKIALSSQHQSSISHKRQERLVLGDLRAETNYQKEIKHSFDKVTFSESKHSHLNFPLVEQEAPSLDPDVMGEELMGTTETQLEVDKSRLDQLLPPNLTVLKGILEKIFGQRFQIFVVDNHTSEIHIEIELETNQTPQAEPFSYDYSESYQENEQTDFLAEGVIKTKDGKEIEFTVNLNMSRSYSSQLNIHIDNGVKVDPLVINFDGEAVKLGDKKFNFDINADGVEEELSVFTSNSGFLALDKNKDGEINNGEELFGPKSGNGFSELASYDEDGNQFIDENDSIYKALRVMQVDEEGNVLLRALLDLNIGAIYVGHQATPFSIKSQNNESLGEIKSTGIYVSDEGRVGTIQEIDFIV
jgi:hypothetical protein